MQRTRTYTLEDSRAFGRLSGDVNPLHVDPLAARRTPFGAPVVHGLHLVLTALDLLAEHHPRLRLAGVNATFQKPVLVDEAASFEITWRDETTALASVSVAGRKVSTFQFTLPNETAADSQFQTSNIPRPVAEDMPRRVSWEEAAETSGVLVPSLDERELVNLLPHSESLPHDQIAILVTMSRLVGMECPGLYSLFSRLQLDFTSELSLEHEIEYRTSAADPRFNLLNFAINGRGLGGEVKAFMRPAPASQLTFQEARQLVERQEFSGRDVLVVGGSRGLGEVASKLLAAGGARLCLTYSRGQQDANRVCDEINAFAPPTASTIHLDVHAAELATEWPRITQQHPDFGARGIDLLYFATPTIRPGTKHGFRAEHFHAFASTYLEGLVRVTEAIRDLNLPIGNALIPSSIYVEERPAELAEYIVAKAATEAACVALAQLGIFQRVHTPRWPRMKTDQTLSTVPETLPEPSEIVLGSLRQLYGARVHAQDKLDPAAIQ